jgi:hypothetical protein
LRSFAGMLGLGLGIGLGLGMAAAFVVSRSGALGLPATPASNAAVGAPPTQVVVVATPTTRPTSVPNATGGKRAAPREPAVASAVAACLAPQGPWQVRTAEGSADIVVDGEEVFTLARGIELRSELRERLVLWWIDADPFQPPMVIVNTTRDAESGVLSAAWRVAMSCFNREYLRLAHGL